MNSQTEIPLAAEHRTKNCKTIENQVEWDVESIKPKIRIRPLHKKTELKTSRKLSANLHESVPLEV